MTPDVKGKEFESLVLFRAQRMEEAGILMLGRYGTQVVMMNDDAGIPRWQPIPSLPDMEGIIPPSGRQIILECKVCSQASHPVHQQGKKHPKQIDHMLRRAKFGALCFYLVHFNSRDLKTKAETASTWAIPVHPDIHFWREYEAAERLSLSRADAELHGVSVPWDLYSTRASKLTPNLTTLIQ